MKTRYLEILVIVLFSAMGARADTIDIVFDSPTLTGSPGDTLAFFGTLTNSTGIPVYLNSDNFNLSGLPFSSVNDLLNNVPLFLDSSGSPAYTSGDIELFDITIPSGQAPDSYNGSYALFGGADSNASDPVGAANFAVNVQQQASVPEPDTFALLVLALAWLAIARRRAVWLLPAAKHPGKMPQR
ncbi:MAG TPA: PEP-CTERM sorting domain-containing protein [Bryobacteraceae bacterium]|nr:PEP-CTERM sorting domain-containing protein [Bryobacteraceae bacterium]